MPDVSSTIPPESGRASMALWISVPPGEIVIVELEGVLASSKSFVVNQSDSSCAGLNLRALCGERERGSSFTTASDTSDDVMATTNSGPSCFSKLAT